MLVFLPDSSAQNPTQEAVKAAYLFKLKNYVEWPTRLSSPSNGRAVIGVIGADEVFDALRHMPAMRDPASSGVTVRKVSAGESLEGLHILFVGESAWRRASSLVAEARRHSILIVSESEGAVFTGSIVNFRLVDERVRLEISLESAEKSNLRLSSQILALALTVVREKQK